MYLKIELNIIIYVQFKNRKTENLTLCLPLVLSYALKKRN